MKNWWDNLGDEYILTLKRNEAPIGLRPFLAQNFYKIPYTDLEMFNHSGEWQTVHVSQDYPQDHPFAKNNILRLRPDWQPQDILGPLDSKASMEAAKKRAIFAFLDMIRQEVEAAWPVEK